MRQRIVAATAKINQSILLLDRITTIRRFLYEGSNRRVKQNRSIDSTDNNTLTIDKFNSGVDNNNNNIDPSTEEVTKE